MTARNRLVPIVLIAATLIVLLVSRSIATYAAECDAVVPDGWSTYTIVEGDTLYDIALASGATLEELIAVNCLPDTGVVVVGETIYVPLIPDTPLRIQDRCRLIGLSDEECENYFGDGDGLQARCRAAGLTTEACREIAGSGDNTPMVVRRCREAGLSLEECRAVVSGGDQNQLQERCRNAGLTQQECRRVVNGQNDDEGNVLERCNLAGLTTQECRRLVNQPDDMLLQERCREAGLDTVECRRLMNANQNNDDTGSNVAERCRLAGYNSPEECRRYLNSVDDDIVDPVAPEVDERCRLAGYNSPEECRRYLNSNGDDTNDNGDKDRDRQRDNTETQSNSQSNGRNGR